MHATGQPAGIDRAEFRDAVQSRVVQGGGVLHGEHDVVIQAPRRSRGETMTDILDGDTGVGIEAIGRLGLALVTRRLGIEAEGCSKRSTRIVVIRL